MSEIQSAEDLIRTLGDMLRDRREHERRTWLTYDEWRVLFKHAHRLKILDVEAATRGEFCTGYRTACMGSFFARWLYRVFRGFLSAKKRGLSDQQFDAEFCDQIDHDSNVGKRAVATAEQSRRESLDRAERERRAGSDRRRRPADDDQEIAEVRIGYQPQEVHA